MSGHQRESEPGDRAEARIENPTTSSKVANECVTDEPQAQRYEHKFRSFSGAGDDPRLAALTTTESASHSSAANDDRTRNSQFVLEDRQNGVEHTAHGERTVDPDYKPRPSFLLDLRAAIANARNPQDAEEQQALFSIAYMTRKAQEMFAAAKRILPPGKNDGTSSAVIASNPASASDTALTPAKIIHDHVLLAQSKDSKSEKPVPIDHIQEFASTPKAVIGEFRRILAEPNRNVGEFSGAVADIGGHVFGSGMHYGAGFEYAGSQYHLELANAFSQLKQAATIYGLSPMKQGGLKSFEILAILHTHPDLKDGKHDPQVFSPDDMRCADKNGVPSYLLRPDNSVIVYTPHSKKPAGELLGRYNSDGSFTPSPRFAKIFANS